MPWEIPFPDNVPILRLKLPILLGIIPETATFCRSLSEKKAKVFIEKKDKQRRNYHDSHGVEGWGDATTYDICISSSYFGIEETADFLCAYIEKRMAKLK